MQVGRSGAPVPAGVPALKPRRVLVVDDQETARLILQRLLTAWGQDVVTVASGEEALARVEAEEQAGRHFDAVLLDWKMPGMNGLDVARELENAVRDGRLAHPLLVVMVTAHEKEGLLEEARGLTLDGVLTKPVTPSTLLDALTDARLLSPAADASPPREPRLAGARVLLVEDNQVNQEVAAAFLTRRGVAVTTANNGREAVAWVQRQPFDAVLMDLHMPIMDGFEATRCIRDLPQGQKLPIIAMTAAVMQEDRDRCTAAGMADFVPKPIDPDALAAILARWLGGEAPVVPPPAPAPAGDFDPAGALHRLDGDRALYARLLHAFVREQGDVAARVETLLANGEREQAAALLHAVKGAGANLGAVALAREAAELETAVRRGEEHPALASFIAALQGALAAMTAYHAEARAPASPADPGALAQLVAALRPYLEEGELVPDPLLHRLHALADAAPPGAPVTELLRRIDRFDHAGALSLLDSLEAELTGNAAPASPPGPA